MDLTAEFYLQTVDTVFVQHLLPRGLMTHRGRTVDLAAITNPALMTVEGEMDDITGTGQCRVAHDLCDNIPPQNKAHFECPRVGHYGVFNGSRFRSEIAPRMAKFMRAHDPCAGANLTISQLEHMATMPRRARRTQELEGAGLQFCALQLNPTAFASLSQSRHTAAFSICDATMVADCCSENLLRQPSDPKHLVRIVYASGACRRAHNADGQKDETNRRKRI